MENTEALALNTHRSIPRYSVCVTVNVYLGEKKGRVVDVSMDGIGISLDDAVFTGYHGTVDIEIPDEGFYLSALPVQALSHCATGKQKRRGEPSTIRCGVHFSDLKPHQRFKWMYLVRLCAKASVEKDEGSLLTAFAG